MDFGFTREQEEFRLEAREFIRSKLPEGWSRQHWRYGFDYYSHVEVAGPVARMMSQELGRRGWLSIRWPREYGGQGGSYIDQLILAEELAFQHAPGIEIFGSVIAPVIIEFGTVEQKAKHLPGIQMGVTYWCECLSEPGSGSDLASLQTNTREEGDQLVLNGQKVWTSAAHTVDYSFVLARTNPDLPRHRGLSVLLLDLKNPGVTVRPLVNANGEHAFNEVFFDNIVVPRENVLGGLNNGWRVCLRLLDFERILMVPWYAESKIYLEDLMEYIRSHGKLEPALRLRFAQLLSECEAARLVVYRAAALADQNLDFSLEAALAKVYGSELNQRVAVLGMEILGPYGQLVEGSARAVLGGRAAWHYIRSLGNSIEMGTSEIDRNILAQRGLGLPRE